MEDNSFPFPTNFSSELLSSFTGFSFLDRDHNIRVRILDSLFHPISSQLPDPRSIPCSDREINYSSLLQICFQLNNLHFVIPNFALIYGLEYQPLEKSHLEHENYFIPGKDYHLLTEKLPILTFEELICQKCSIDDWISVFSQVYFSLEIAFGEFGFIHQELHLNQIRLTRLDIPVRVDYPSISLSINYLAKIYPSFYSTSHGQTGGKYLTFEERNQGFGSDISHLYYYSLQAAQKASHHELVEFLSSLYKGPSPSPEDLSSFHLDKKFHLERQLKFLYLSPCTVSYPDRIYPSGWSSDILEILFPEGSSSWSSLFWIVKSSPYPEIIFPCLKLNQRKFLNQCLEKRSLYYSQIEIELKNFSYLTVSECHPLVYESQLFQEEFQKDLQRKVNLYSLTIRFLQIESILKLLILLCPSFCPDLELLSWPEKTTSNQAIQEIYNFLHQNLCRDFEILLERGRIESWFRLFANVYRIPELLPS